MKLIESKTKAVGTCLVGFQQADFPKLECQMQIELRRPRAHRLTGQPAKQELASVFQAKRASERGKRLPGKLRLISIIPTQPAAEASASGRRRS